ncbi:MAG: hemerythrin domain-containing protein [Betaproteobacteria bacterium]|nr:hemerythrin domain-containing protein [Betaproteobacteria bacterium]
MHKSIRVLRDEHRSIAAVLHGLQHLARAAQDPGVRPEFEVFRAMIYYIDAFPERQHHPKEDDYLFAHVARRAPQVAALVDELRAEHVKGAQLVRDLERALLEFEQSWPRGAGAFAAAVDEYAELHWEHMRKEEHELLPLAEQHLTAEDWGEIDAAFAENVDPLSDLEPEGEFAKLYTRIVTLAPAPIGLGESWRRGAGAAWGR